MLIGFENDDWSHVLAYKSLGKTPLSKILYVWTTKEGIYYTMLTYYTGILFDVFGFDYPRYDAFNIGLKIIATLSVYPMIVLIFKRRLLAFLATILYAISYDSVGGLTYVNRGIDYIAITIMNLFFICYYFSIIKNSRLWLPLSCITLLASFILSSSRIYPILGVILLIEVVWCLKNGFKNSIKASILRILILFLPVALLIFPAKKIVYVGYGGPVVNLTKIVNGNWDITLLPFAGLGHLFMNGNQPSIITQSNPYTFTGYLSFITGFSFIFVVLTAFLKFFLPLSKRDFLVIIFVNFVLQILIYFISTHFLSIPKILWSRGDENIYWIQKYFVFIGVYFTVIAFFYFLKFYMNNLNNRILWAVIMGPIFALIFIAGYWVILGQAIEGFGRYLQVPALGTSLFLAALLTLFYDKKLSILKPIKILLILILISFALRNSQKNLDLSFRLGSSRNSYVHKYFQETFINLLQKKGIIDHKQVLFYFEVPKESARDNYGQLLDLSNFMKYMPLRLGSRERCIGLIYYKKQLEETIIQVKGGKKTISYPSTCIGRYTDENLVNWSQRLITYKLADFHAFWLDRNGFIDITDKVINSLAIKEY